MAQKHPAPPNPFLRGSAAPSIPVALPLVALNQTTTVPVAQPTPTDTETVPEGDIMAQAMEQIITPEERQQLARATPEECGQLEQQAMQHVSVLMQGVTSEPTSREDPEIRTEAQVHTVQMQPMETDMETDNLLQGEIGPLLTIKEQEAMSQHGVYLVVATHVVGMCLLHKLRINFSQSRNREKYDEKEVISLFQELRTHTKCIKCLKTWNPHF